MKNKNQIGGNKLKTCFIAALAALLVAAPFCLQAENKKQLVINEIQIGGNKADEEFVELYNPTNEKIPLNGFALKKIYNKKNEVGEYVATESVLVSKEKFVGEILPHNFFVIAHANHAANIKDSLAYSGKDYYLSDNMGVVLYDDIGKILDKVGWGMVKDFEKKSTQNPGKNESIGRLRGIDTDDNSADFSLQKPTPGAENSKAEIDEKNEKDKNLAEEIVPEIAKIVLGKLSIDEHIYPNTYAYFAIEKKEDEKVMWNFGDGHRSYLAKTKHKYEAIGTYAASVKVYKGDAGSMQNFVVSVEEYPRPKVRIVKINANPKGSDSKKETITIENKTKQKINLKGWSVATGWRKLVNHVIREDFEIKAGKEKELTRDKCAFTLVNTKDRIELRYPDGSVADEVKYKKKKDETIAEEEMYVKGRKGWKWEGGEKVISNSKLKITNENAKAAQDTMIKSQETNKNQNPITNNQTANEEVVGTNAQVVNRVEIMLVPKNEIELAVAKNNNDSAVLGASIVRESERQYFFTLAKSGQEHYMVMFLKKLNAKINMLLNSILY